MSSQTPLDDDLRGATLLERLKGWKGHHSEFNSLLFISFAILPVGEASAELWRDLQAVLIRFRSKYEGVLYRLSLPDRAVLVNINEYNQVGMITDLKVELLRMIQQYFPHLFDTVDQSRLLRIIDLRLKLPNAIRFLELYENPSADTAATAIKRRPLNEVDIRKVDEINEKLGSSAFAKAFITRQRLAVINPGESPSDVMHEYYVAMGLLNKHVFEGVDLRGSGNLFNQLTITLDRCLLDAFGDANPARAKCSINLNVESVFTRSFEAFLGDKEENIFSNIVFEFRQGNILQHFDEFMVAANLIASRNGTIAVDAVFPEMVGVVNLARLGASMAKIFWRQGAETILPGLEDEIRSLADAGIMVALARLDDETGLEIGHRLGINLFQGFYVDRLLDAAA